MTANASLDAVTLTQTIEMQKHIYTHKGIEFQWAGGLNIYRKQDLFPMKLQLNNGSPSWRINKNTWLSVKQLKTIIKK